MLSHKFQLLSPVHFFSPTRRLTVLFFTYKVSSILLFSLITSLLFTTGEMNFFMPNLIHLAHIPRLFCWNLVFAVSLHPHLENTQRLFRLKNCLSSNFSSSYQDYSKTNLENCLSSFLTSFTPLFFQLKKKKWLHSAIKSYKFFTPLQFL